MSPVTHYALLLLQNDYVTNVHEQTFAIPDYNVAKRTIMVRLLYITGWMF